MKNKGILSKQCIKGLKPIKSTDVKQARVPTFKRKNKTQSSINKLSFLWRLLWIKLSSYLIIISFDETFPLSTFSDFLESSILFRFYWILKVSEQEISQLNLSWPQRSRCLKFYSRRTKVECGRWVLSPKIIFSDRLMVTSPDWSKEFST